MWANWEVVALAEWLRRRNAALPDDEQAGFYGLDVYSLWESLDAVLDYLERIDPDAAVLARDAYRCFEPYAENLQEYAYATAFVPTSCEAEVVELLTELRRNAHAYREDSREGYFDAEQNALVARNAERYYRTMLRGGAPSWNIRDRHMAETLDRLMRHHGPEAKAIVWEHNTHIGDARATDMARAGMVNVGQLVREAHAGEGVVLVGYGSYEGSVVAGRTWGAPMERLPVPPARSGSWEDLLHRAGAENKLLLLDGQAPPLRDPRGHRAIGVVYNPEQERTGNYVPTVLPYRYDAFLYIDRTRALHPLHVPAHRDGEPPDTYPWAI
jgi:erythromycin esterase-like protein